VTTPPQLVRIAVLLESSRAFGRGVLQGLAECLQARRHWMVYYQEGGLGELLPGWFAAWQGDGVIARIEDRRMAAALAQKRIPVVDIRGRLPIRGVPVVRTDHDEISRMTAEHLMERGFRRFAFCGYEGADYSTIRRDAFARTVRHAGFPCHVFSTPEPRVSAIRKQEQYGWAHEGHLIEWLRRLPKPIGIMACNDARGHQLLNAARQAEVLVPDEVAVVGVDDYKLICELADPPLSSVEQNTRRIAQEAVLVLEGMMAGRRPPTAPIVVKPCRLVTRRSSDALAITDDNLRAAMRCIQTRAHTGIGVDDVARAAGMSRRDLERKFRTSFGHAPGEALLRTQLKSVRTLLTETNLPLYRIAEKTGFSHPEYLNVVFKREMGLTPRGYRLKMGHERRSSPAR
jgi:LacI family transcriptional regulator